MTQERASSPKQMLARMLSITRRTRFATSGPWAYLRPSGVICAPDTSDVAHCLHDPDAVFIAHDRADILWLLDQLQAERSSDPTLDAQLLDRVLVLRAAIRGGQRLAEQAAVAGRRASRLGRRGLDREQARWVGRVVEEVASALDPETLGLKDSDR
jgi:hypothetical protein